MPRRRALISGLSVLIAALVQSAPSPVRALSCDDGLGDLRFAHLSAGGSFVTNRRVPLDVQPWLFGECGQRPDACALVAEDDSIALSAEIGECSEATDRARVTFTPERRLLAGRTYTLTCADGFEGEGRLIAVNSGGAPPIDVEIIDNHLGRDDDGCCSDGGWLDLQVSLKLGAGALDFFREGGRIDVVGPDGDLGSITSTPGEWLLLPNTKGAHSFTAVAADGTRGAAVTLAESEINAEPVYIPCAIGSRSSLPFTLFLPFLWLAVGRRRAVRSA